MRRRAPKLRIDDRQRRRADRRDHVVHQHVEPERACSPPACSRRRRSSAGLTVKPHVKTSLAPGSRVVTEYLTKAGLLPYLDKLGFNLVGYGCTTCIGNAGDLLAGDRRGDHEERPRLRRGAVGQPQLRGAHPPEHQGQLPRRRRRWSSPTRSPGRVDIDLIDRADRQGQGRQATSTSATSGRRCDEVARADASSRLNARGLPQALRRFREGQPDCGTRSDASTGQVYDWPKSTYIAEPPFFDGLRDAAAAADRATSRARARWASSATRSRPTTSARRARSRRLAGRELPDGARRRRRPTSTATARAAATTK